MPNEDDPDVLEPDDPDQTQPDHDESLNPGLLPDDLRTATDDDGT